MRGCDARRPHSEERVGRALAIWGRGPKVGVSVAAALLLIACAGCAGESDPAASARPEGARLTPELAAQAISDYAESFTRGDFDRAAARLATVHADECGGVERLAESLEVAHGRDPLRFSLARVVDVTVGPPVSTAHAVVTFRGNRGTGETTLRLGLIRQAGTWRLGEIYPAGATAYCHPFPGYEP